MIVLARINHVLLFLLAFATGAIKVAGLFTNGVAFEFQLFEQIGFSFWMVVLFGVVQIAGGLMLLHKKTLHYGAITLLVTFVIATSPLFVVKNFTFAFFSLIFWVMAFLCYKRNWFTPATA